MAYLPSKDAELGAWCLNFSTLLTADPPRYGLLPADALVVSTQYDIFAAAYLLAINPATKTVVTVADKDGEKVTLLAIVRQYAALIRANKGVADDDKAALGLTIPDPTPTPIEPPASSPKLSITLGSEGYHSMGMVDSATPLKKAKPYGCVGAQLVCINSTSNISPDFTNAPTLAIVTKGDFLLDTTPYAGGSFCHYRARWFTSTGKFGPWGAPIFFVVQGSAPAPAP